jgi:hypothetical protein
VESPDVLLPSLRNWWRSEWHVNYRQLKQAASETSYAAPGPLDVPSPVPGQKPKAL